MARSATKSGKRPQPNAQRKPAAAPPARRPGRRSGGEGLFFERLRRNAKWVFVVLAVAFALSFVALGVGSGSAGLGDLLQGNFSGLFGGGGGPSVSKAQKQIEKHPNDPKAYKALADAYQARNDVDAAIPPLEKYVSMRPKDVDALQTLAGDYQDRAARLQQYAYQIQTAAPTFTPAAGITLDPSSSLGKEFQDDDLTKALQDAVAAQQAPIQTAYQEAQRKEIETWQNVVKAQPDDPSWLLQLAQAAQSAGDTTTLISAYRQFLKLAPDDPSASDIRKQLKQLQAQQAPAPAPQANP